MQKLGLCCSEQLWQIFWHNPFISLCQYICLKDLLSNCSVCALKLKYSTRIHCSRTSLGRFTFLLIVDQLLFGSRFFVLHVIHVLFFLFSRNFLFLQQGFGSGSVSGSAWIRINLSCWIRIRIRIQIADPDPDPGGQKWPQKIEKRTEFSSFEVLDVLFWGLKASPVAWEFFMGA